MMALLRNMLQRATSAVRLTTSASERVKSATVMYRVLTDKTKMDVVRNIICFCVVMICS